MPESSEDMCLKMNEEKEEVQCIRSATAAFRVPRCQRIHRLTLSVCFIATKARADL